MSARRSASTPRRLSGHNVPRGQSFRDADAGGSAGDKVLTVVRVKPEAAETQRGVGVSDGNTISLSSRNERASLSGSGAAATPDSTYRFDHVLKEDSSQDEVFELAGVPIVSACLDGYNGTIFAYGQTGSGKTHTLKGSLTRRSQRGLMPRAVEYIFDKIKERTVFKSEGSRSSGSGGGKTETPEHGEEATVSETYEVSMSYLQIYKERISDLLDDKTASSRFGWGICLSCMFFPHTATLLCVAHAFSLCLANPPALTWRTQLPICASARLLTASTLKA